MKKYGDATKLDVLRGKEANVLNEHMKRTGKTQVSKFSDEEMEALQTDLEEARKE